MQYLIIPSVFLLYLKNEVMDNMKVFQAPSAQYSFLLFETHWNCLQSLPPLVIFYMYVQKFQIFKN